MEKIYILRKKLIKKQEVTEDMFAKLTPKEMIDLARLLVSDYNNICISNVIKNGRSEY